MPDVLPATIDLGEKFAKLFITLKKKLWGDETEAYEKLRDVVDELMKFYLAMQNEISNFISMDFSDSKHSQENKKALIAIVSGGMIIRINDARGHCKRIKRIYEAHLDKWFRKKLKATEYSEMKNLFFSLSIYDDDMLMAAENLEKDLQEKSTELLNLLNTNKKKAAVESQAKNQEKFLPRLTRLSKVMNQLMILRNQFMEMSKAS
jgi:hypothetical protein